MNKILFRFLLICTMAVLPAWGVLSAQEAETVRLGYCGDNTGGALIAQTDQPSEYHAAIRLPASILNKYIGAKIKKIDFAITEKAGQMMTVFITNDLYSSKPLRTQTFYDFEAGWNSITLNQPYTIRQGEDLYIGYVAYTTVETANAKIITFEFEAKKRVDGVNFYGEGDWWNEVPPSVDFNLCIRAYAEGEGLPHHDVQVSKLTSADLIVQNKQTNAEFNVWNHGLDPVENIDVEVSANGQVFDTKHLTGVFVEPNAGIPVSLEGISFPEEGNNTLEVKVTKINGKDDSDPNDNAANRTIYAIKEGAQPAVRNVLFEHFTSESDETAPEADALYAEAIGNDANVISIKHHTDDKYELDAESPYARFFDNNRMFYPAILVDRNMFQGLGEVGPAYFVGSKETAQSLISSSRSIPSYITPKVALEYNEDTRRLHITASGKAEVKEMPFQKDLRLTVYVVEDRVASTTQTGKENYQHNGVIRAIPCETCWGDPINISSYNFQKEYEVTLDEEWNPANIRVVAVVSNYNEKSDTEFQVYNAASNTISGLSGIGQATKGGGEPEIWIVDGNIQVESGYTLLGVFDISGKKIDTACLTPGIYIVRTTDGNRTYHRKVVVK